MRFNASQLLGGNWEPYPIDMQFAPPCMVLSTIGGCALSSRLCPALPECPALPCHALRQCVGRAGGGAGVVWAKLVTRGSPHPTTLQA